VQQLFEVERKCLEWRWKLKKRTHRLCQVHGDFHPWNVMFREDTDFAVLDRSRGVWGEAADDVSAMTINFILYSLRAWEKLHGPFKHLFELFWNRYLEGTGDQEILTVIPPFYAWRALVIASPVWYPNLRTTVRVKLFNFIQNVLSLETFNITEVNSYFSTWEG
jgi:aminoglycoside phosphotransferase family enzyme